MTPLRKPMVLAMLAAGVIASDGLSEAQSTVFVPELAMLDGALCTGTMATAPFRPLLLAQAKTEVSPAAAKTTSAPLSIICFAVSLPCGGSSSAVA